MPKATVKQLKVELVDNWVIRADQRQFILCKERKVADGILSTNQSYCSSMSYALTSFISKMVKSSDAQSFEAVAQEIKDAAKIVVQACLNLGLDEKGHHPEYPPAKKNTPEKSQNNDGSDEDDQDDFDDLFSDDETLDENHASIQAEDFLEGDTKEESSEGTSEDLDFGI